MQSLLLNLYLKEVSRAFILAAVLTECVIGAQFSKEII